ncbi:MAG TPA: protein translocase subunit SecF, partial [Halieaceae bacterium]|nr:protein translocase subunit SecF [Halieaceae bacterium]
MRVIDFMGWRRIALAISVGFLLLSVASFFTRQLAWGLDFTGGTLVE